MTDRTPQSQPKPKLPSNFSVLTFKTACTTCGASVEFASAASVMAVCDYCQSTIVRDGEEIYTQGKQSLALEDYSPLQIGSMGEFQQVSFVIVGRIQLEYEEGIWNEWYLQFANGHNGWLSEALGQYSLTLDKGKQPLPSYHQLTVNQSIEFAQKSYVISDKRTALAIAGEGELPFIMGSGWQTWVVDARDKRQFITLDYSDGVDEPPTVFKGVSVSLEQLSMQMLKDDRQTNEELSLGSHDGMSTLSLADEESSTTPHNKTTAPVSGRTKVADAVSNVDCPNCGSPVPFVAGVTNCLMCPACFCEIKVTGTQADVVKMHSLMQNYVTSLELGAKARIKEVDLVQVNEFTESNDTSTFSFDNDDGFGGSSDSVSNNASSNSARNEKKSSSKASASNKYHDYVVVGIQRLHEVNSSSRWTEYLLYSFTDGFLWLSEEPKNGWMISRVLNEFPTKRGNSIVYDSQVWKNYQGLYQSRVVFAIGAFNWQVKVNDAMVLIDYTNAKRVITAEQNKEEITYTIAAPVTQKQMQTWFTTQLKQQPKQENYSAYNLDNSAHSMGVQSDDDWDDDDWDDDEGYRSILHLLGGLVAAYIFVTGVFFVSVLACIVGLILLMVATSRNHAYLSVSDVITEVITTKTQKTKAGVWVVIFVATLISFMVSINSTSSSFYYMGNSGRTGYSSSGSHK